MQRDVYASLVKKRSKDFIPVRILQLSGEITHERLYDEVFDGHRLRRIVLMTHMAGSTGGGPSPPAAPSAPSTSSPQQHPLLPQDIVVESFAKLKKVHQEHYMYKLLPLLCESYVAFNALLGIVSSPGSPFRIEHRRDPQAFRMHYPAGSKHRMDVCEALLHETPKEWLADAPLHRRLPLPGNGVDYHGLLINRPAPSSTTTSPSAAAASCAAAQRPPATSGLLSVVEGVSESVLRDHGVMNRFIHSHMYKGKFTSDLVPTFRDFYACHQRFHFVATKKPMPVEARAALLQQAAHEKIHIYEINSAGNFVFAAQ
jgi:hypothetical protein